MIRLDNQLGKLEGRVDASLNRRSWFERNVDSRLDASAQRMVQLEQEVARLRLARGTPQTPNTKRLIPSMIPLALAHGVLTAGILPFYRRVALTLIMGVHTVVTAFGLLRTSWVLRQEHPHPLISIAT